jgi:hypothetical protein
MGADQVESPVQESMWTQLHRVVSGGVLFLEGFALEVVPTPFPFSEDR